MRCDQWLDVYLLGGGLIIWGPSRLCKCTEARPWHMDEISDVTQGSCHAARGNCRSKVALQLATGCRMTRLRSSQQSRCLLIALSRARRPRADTLKPASKN